MPEKYPIHHSFTDNVLESCPSDCNMQGRCLTIQNASSSYGIDYDSTVSSSGDGIGGGSSYDYWDKDSTSLCVCDIGFFGPDCSLGISHFSLHNLMVRSSLSKRR